MSWVKCTLSLHLFKCIITQNIYIKKEAGTGEPLQQMFGTFGDAFVGGSGEALVQ